MQGLQTLVSAASRASLYIRASGWGRLARRGGGETQGGGQVRCRTDLSAAHHQAGYRKARCIGGR